RMMSTTFDHAKGQKGNFAVPHACDADGKPSLAVTEINEAIIPLRPAGGAWSTVHDLLKYVLMEIGNGKLPSGKPYISAESLLARRIPQVALNKDASYGMGLMSDETYGVTVVHHGGDLIG